MSNIMCEISANKCSISVTVLLGQHLRRIPVTQIEVVNDELDRMFEEVIEPSPWVSNLVIVPSKFRRFRGMF